MRLHLHRLGFAFSSRSPSARSHRRLLSVLLAALVACGTAAGCGSSSTANGSGSSTTTSCQLVIATGDMSVPPPPDGASACLGVACNYQTQAGCAANEACRPETTLEDTVEATCEPFGTGTSGTACVSSLDCARGYYCVQTRLGVSSCHKQCCGGDWSACDAGESCIRQLSLGFADHAPAVYAVDLCFPVGTCDPLDPTSCADDLDPPTPRECKVADPTGAVACLPKGTQSAGASCSSAGNACAQGFICVGDDPQDASVSHCRRLCSTSLCCPAAEGRCIHYQRDPADVGECTP